MHLIESQECGDQIKDDESFNYRATVRDVGNIIWMCVVTTFQTRAKINLDYVSNLSSFILHITHNHTSNIAQSISCPNINEVKEGF